MPPPEAACYNRDMPPSASDQPAGGRREFATTHWSLVLAAGGDTRGAQPALAALCDAYWYPLYAFIRRQGLAPHDAQDLTQEFFARLIEKEWLGAVQRERGRFRSWLLAALKHFLANEWDKSRARKRGGGVQFVSIDDATAESRYAQEPADLATADRLYDRRWALTLLDRVLARLREETTRGNAPKDKAKRQQAAPIALSWLVKAAKQGSFSAWVLLGKAFDEGTVFAKDPVEAYKWYHLAIEKGNNPIFAPVTQRNALSLKLTPAQIELAKRRALDFWEAQGEEKKPTAPK